MNSCPEAVQAFQVGDTVKALILGIDHERNRISFGLKPSYFNGKTAAINTSSNVVAREESQVDDGIGSEHSDSAVELDPHPRAPHATDNEIDYVSTRSIFSLRRVLTFISH
jgi:rRNA biogenesis protein RRP5